METSSHEALSEKEQAILEGYQGLDFTVENLGRRSVRNPIREARFIEDDQRVVYPLDLRDIQILQKAGQPVPSFEMGGPREYIYFDPAKLRSAIVTCGGLCPGVNDVIRALVMQLTYVYGAKNIIGIRYGLEGFIPEYKHEHLELGPDEVQNIHHHGGTLLGTSRGHQDPAKIVDALERMNINLLFMIGGDGTIKASIKIQEEIASRGLNIGVVCVPKTIDNDISFIQKSFGFETAFSTAVQAIGAAHNEAKGAFNGIGLVQVMGRHSGHIAVHAALGMREVNFVLIPEVDFDLHGPKGFFEALKKRVVERRHAVVVVAEGAGQRHLRAVDEDKPVEYDKSGNISLLNIGRFLRQEITKYFHEREIPITLKYIDPSYIIRSQRANPIDSVFAGLLAQNAVHAAMAGKTGIVMGRWAAQFTHLPARVAVSRRKSVDPDLWRSVTEATGQPPAFTNDD
ncbi:MAG TPA: ATP-dependent 6-phosphofructokinase [Acidobacteriota bacterium]|nr:ATP-dependent 6-phosphofructokinase [Acidobacteriota bacterium]